MRHCDTCGSCVKASKTHNCIAGSVRADCSVCLEVCHPLLRPCHDGLVSVPHPPCMW